MHSRLARHIGAVFLYTATTSSRVIPGRSLKVMISVITPASSVGRYAPMIAAPGTRLKANRGAAPSSPHNVVLHPVAAPALGRVEGGVGTGQHLVGVARRALERDDADAEGDRPPRGRGRSEAGQAALDAANGGVDGCRAGLGED